MHILILHQAFATPRQAGGTRHFELARHLVEWGHRVTVVASQVSYLSGKSAVESSQGAWSTTHEGGVEIRWVRTYSGHHRSFLHRSLAFASFSLLSLRAALVGLKPDVVIGTTPPPLQSLSAYVVARRRRVPFVFEIRDLFWDYALQTGALTAGLMVSLARGMEDWLCRSADHLVVNSPGFTSYLEQRGNSKERITLIPNSVDTEMFSPNASRRSVWEPYDCQDKFIVLYAGAHGMLNDLDTLLQAAERLKSHQDICVCLMGDGKEKSKLIERARTLGIDNVRFIPAQTKSATPAFVASADVCVATLRDLPVLRTVYPNKVFDYMASGRPVLIGIDGEIRQVVEKAGAGLFVRPSDSSKLADAILQLYQDPVLSEQMGANGRQYVCEHFDRVDQARKLEAMLLQVVDREA